MDKTKWSAKAIRKILNNNDTIKDNCFVCGKHQAICELHHIIPIKELTGLVNMGVVDLFKISTPIVWLCPNCHAYIHKAMNGSVHVLIEELSKNELSNALTILKTYDDSFGAIVDTQNKTMSNFNDLEHRP